MILTDGQCLVSDESVEELHRFAKWIDLPPRWYRPGRMPHFELAGTKSAEALRAGAVKVGSQELWRRAKRR